MSQLVQIAQTVLSFIVVLGILVFVHEFGHFIVAKAFKIGVPVFSLGFGPRLWGFRRKETDYRVSAVPLGGYVRLAGRRGRRGANRRARTSSSRARGGSASSSSSRGRRFNIVLAVVVMTVVFATWGRDEVVRPETFPTVADVAPGVAGRGGRASPRGQGPPHRGPGRARPADAGERDHPRARSD